MASARFTWQSALIRAVIGLAGGFCTALLFMVGVASLLIKANWLQRADAAMAAGMLAFVVWAMAILIAFGTTSVLRAALWILGSAGGFSLLGWQYLYA